MAKDNRNCKKKKLGKTAVYFDLWDNEIKYDGKHDLHEEVCEIKWQVCDLLSMLVRMGYEPTDENLDCLVNGSIFAKTLEELSIEFGWDYMKNCLSLYCGSVPMCG